MCVSVGVEDGVGGEGRKGGGKGRQGVKGDKRECLSA